MEVSGWLRRSWKRAGPSGRRWQRRPAHRDIVNGGDERCAEECVLALCRD